MTQHRNVSGHPDDLTGGRIVGAGEFVELSDEDLKDPFNKAKIDAGVFAPVGEPKDDPPPQPSRDELLARAKELEIPKSSSMRNDELQTAINQAEEQKKGDDA